MPRLISSVVLAGVLALTACAMAPSSEPNILVLPGDGKTPALFEQDDAACRQHAGQQISGEASAGQATAAGGASGVTAASVTQAPPMEQQRRFDAGYAQCMTSRGNTVPTTPGGAPYLFTPYSYSSWPAYPGPYVGGSAVVLGAFGGGWRHYHSVPGHRHRHFAGGRPGGGWRGGLHGGWRGGGHHGGGGGRHGGGRGSRGGRR